MKRTGGTTLAIVATTATVAVTAALVGVPAAASEPSTHGTQLIVGYRAGAPEATSDTSAAADASGKARAHGVTTSFQRRLGTGATVLRLNSTRESDVDSVIAGFEADPEVEYVERDATLHALSADPSDTEYSKQWDLFEEKAGMNVPSAWETSTGRDVTVAVIDTGYVTHSELEPAIVPGYDFISSADRARDNDGRDASPADEGDWNGEGECGPDSRARTSSWHGTHVAGTVAATTDNEAGIAGIATDAAIQPIRVLGKCGGSLSDIADAIVWASGGRVPGVATNPSPANVINMSLGGPGQCSRTTQRAIDGALQRGTTVVVASGNSNQDVSGFNPANCTGVISVAASNRDGAKAFYSNFGDLIDITAPGGQTRGEGDTPGTITTPENGILSTVNAGEQRPTEETYKPMMGTSMAAPHIAGLAALLLGKDNALTPDRVEALIKENARPLPGPCEGGCGAGLADAARTVGSSSGR